MDFNGFVISDYNGIDHINPETYTFSQKVEAGVNAGIDMFMQPQNFEQFEATLTDLVTSGQVPTTRIDDAVSRILTKKFELGLFEHPYTDRRYIGQVRFASSSRAWRAARPPSHRCCSEQPPGAADPGPPRHLCGRLERRQHRQPSRRLDPDLAGRLHQRDPRTTILDGIRQLAHGNVTYSQDASAPIPVSPPASWWSARPRTPRASATCSAHSGRTTRATTACRGR